MKIGEHKFKGAGIFNESKRCSLDPTSQLPGQSWGGREKEETVSTIEVVPFAYM